MNEFMQSKFKQIIMKSTTQDQLYLKNQRGNGNKRGACKKNNTGFGIRNTEPQAYLSIGIFYIIAEAHI